ncbi:HDOD domain-containing protein [Uliginosibacterium sp. H1]|uniref:HDOD domain-containing protein n=1 Tax=Uliginosibacterium sp. H1 TaxID=3114757 RepID=UPI002E17E5F1|nr:HDOD domain-containing protein [Uliginosibacterium sp. H1]
MTPMERLFASIPNLPSMPKVVQEMIASLEDEDADIGGLVKQLRQDQSLSARVLRLANSSYYGASHKVGAIDDAVTVIGLNALRTIVIASGVTGAFTKVPGIDLQAFWRHGMVTAGVARQLGRMAGLSGEFAYTAGLMHRLGVLLIDLAFPEKGRQIAADCKDLSIAELAAIEQLHLQTDHTEVGAELARLWHFPAVIQSALRWYADPLHDVASPHASVVHIAAQIAFGLEHEDAADKIIADLSPAVLERVVLDKDRLAEVIDNSRELLASANQMLA